MITFLTYWLATSFMAGLGLALLGGIRNDWEDPSTDEENAEQMAWLAARAK